MIQPRLCRGEEDLGPGAFCVICGRMPRGNSNRIALVWIPICEKCCEKLQFPSKVKKDLYTPAPVMQYGKTYTSFLDLIGEKVTYLPLNANNQQHLSYMHQLVAYGCIQPDVRARYGQALGIPQQYWYANFAEFAQAVVPPGAFFVSDENARMLLDLSTGRSNWFATGHAGTGKSHLAAAWLYAMAPYYVCSRLSARWIRMGDFLATIRQTYDKNHELHGKANEFIQEVVDVDVLVIDELATDQLSSHGIDVTLQILEGRANRTCSTFVTTNNDIDAFNKKSERVASRFGGFGSVSFEGMDRRRDPAIQSRALPLPPHESGAEEHNDDGLTFTLQDALDTYRNILSMEQQAQERLSMQRGALLRLLQIYHIPLQQVVPHGDTLDEIYE